MSVKVGQVLRWADSIEYISNITDLDIKVTYYDSYANKLSKTSFSHEEYSTYRCFDILTDIFVENDNGS